MKALLLCLAACGSAPATIANSTPEFPATLRGRTVKKLYAVTQLEQLAPARIAGALGTQIVEVKAESPSGIEYRFAPTAAFSKIELRTAVAIDSHTLMLELAHDLVLTDLDPVVIDARYAMQMNPVHYSNGGFAIGSISHLFGFEHSSLAVQIPVEPRGATVRAATKNAVSDSIDQVSPEVRHGIRAVYISSPNKVPADAPTLRGFRAWAKQNP